MFRFLLIILGLAAFGAYSLVEKAAGPGAAQTAVRTTSEGGLMAGLGNMALSAVANASGVDTAPLPMTGCATSALSQDNINVLLSNLPETQSAALSQLLSSGTQALTVEWYSGELGTGLCIPATNRVVLFPPQVAQTLNALLMSVPQ